MSSVEDNENRPHPEVKKSESFDDQEKGLARILNQLESRLTNKHAMLLYACVLYSLIFRPVQLPFKAGAISPEPTAQTNSGQILTTDRNQASIRPVESYIAISSPTPEALGDGNYRVLSNESVWMLANADNIDVHSGPSRDTKRVTTLKVGYWYRPIGLLQQQDKDTLIDLCLLPTQGGRTNYAICAITTPEGRITNVSYSDDLDGQLRDTYLSGTP